MLVETIANNAESNLSSAIDSSTLSIPVDSAALFPTTGYFRIIIESEIILVKSVSGDTFTAQSRGVEGTTAAAHSDNAVVTHIVTKGAIEGLLAGPIGSEDVEGQGVFLMACHKSTTERTYLMASNDGKAFRSVRRRHMFEPASGNQRDPSIIYWNNKYWIAHTNGANTYWTLLSSIDLLEWVKVMDVDMTSIASVYRVWAPEFYVDDDGTVRVFTSCSTSSSTTNFKIYEQHATNDTLSAWSNPVALTGTSLRTNMIDAFCVKKAGYYHIWYKDDDTKYIEIMRSTSLLTGYTIYKSANWASWGSGLEAPCLVRLSSTKWRIYLNENSGLDSVAVYWSDSSSDDWDSATWSSKLVLGYNWVPAHPSVLRVRDFNTLRHMYALQQDSWRTKGVRVRITSAKTIATSTTTAVTFDVEDQDESAFWDSGANTRITADAPGWYLFAWKVKWSSNTTGKRVCDIRFNGSTFRAGQSAAVVTADALADASGCALYWLDQGEYAELVAYQNSGGNLSLDVATLEAVALA